MTCSIFLGLGLGKVALAMLAKAPLLILRHRWIRQDAAKIALLCTTVVPNVLGKLVPRGFRDCFKSVKRIQSWSKNSLL